ncbi:glycosyltransferase [Marinoscillum sp. MHG1-6]|uniref:glycosyltransferase n=1 Tax=Marinoscillum sp. MHG1-6 TaxID=2959627 RepID=UPI002157EAD7|nr:glycosyltransferase [Marinoscillum sp. MHG1-6]
MSDPLVSVICLSHNHKPFVQEAINSVFNQSYQNIELIVVDDASSDGTQAEIAKSIAGKKVKFLALDKNLGNCRAFNLGFAQSTGDFIIDLAADDVLLPQRIEVGVADFLHYAEGSGVHFSDAFLIDAGGQITGTHYNRDAEGRINEHVPDGDVYKMLIKKYFICPPTMMVKRQVLKSLNGYDENLHYEDFDFWIRSSRNYKYIFNHAPLVKKRILKSGLGNEQTKWRNKHGETTLRVCNKILELNRTPEEFQALRTRGFYEIRNAIRHFNFHLVPKYLKLISESRKSQRRLSSPSSIDK